MAAKINLNTATKAELDKLPHVGAHRSEAIIAARTKEKFKDWNDFAARKVVPAEYDHVPDRLADLIGAIDRDKMAFKEFRR